MSTFVTILWTIIATAGVAQPSDFVMLQFTSANCEPCKLMNRHMDRLSEEGWIIRQVDPKKEPQLVTRWEVKRLPTTIILKQGKEVDRIVGKVELDELRKKLPATGTTPKTNLASHSHFNRPGAIGKSASSDSGLSFPSSLHTPSHKEQSFAPNDFGGTVQQASFTSNAPSNDPMESTVRIKIEDGQYISYGSGTIIDQHGGEALVLTCGHLFRQGGGRSEITVDVPMDGKLVTLPATVIDFRCDEMDIGLISFHAGRPVAVAPLLPRGVKLQEKQSVCSIGCDNGADPSRRDSYISKLNRYLGPSNVEVAKAPVQGRSGGGLFNAQGQLIGVCYAADEELDEGLFSGPEVVYSQLERLGLTRLYSTPSKGSTDLAIASANAPSRPSFASSIETSEPPMALPQIGLTPRSSSSELRLPDAFPDQTDGDAWKRAVAEAAKNTASTFQPNSTSIQPNSSSFQPNMSLGSMPHSQASSEMTDVTVTAVIRDAQGREQVMTIPRASTALLQAIQAQSIQAQPTRTASR